MEILKSFDYCRVKEGSVETSSYVRVRVIMELLKNYLTPKQLLQLAAELQIVKRDILEEDVTEFLSGNPSSFKNIETMKNIDVFMSSFHFEENKIDN